MVVESVLPANETPETDDAFVPALRQDLEIIRGWPHHTGEPTWMLFDPLKNQYFRIGRLFFSYLEHWKLASVQQVQNAVALKLKRPVADKEFNQFLKFLFSNQLTAVPPQDGYKFYYEKEKFGRRTIFSKMLHGYLFFKVPLFRPDRFLTSTWPYVRHLFSRSGCIFYIFCSILGLYLVSRQWSVFEVQFTEFLSFHGFLFYAFSLVLVKICHELGHAYMAHKYGIRVPIIGAAFLVLMPILYTDTSNAWRLTSRRRRLMIDFAGIMAELALASVATILWVFLPDGLLRSAAFSVAAVSWLLSLLVNLNPFMRFDGYYILSDFLGIENLQSRGFALARWKLRELLFKLVLQPPERMVKNLQRMLIFHAWGTWIYRFFLFLGIAFLIYTFFIKVVAIFLFVVEIGFFILLPIFRETKTWWGMRQMILKSKRSYVTASLLGLGAFLFFAPLSNEVVINAVVHTSQDIKVYPPISGKLEVLNVKDGMLVDHNSDLATFSSENLRLKVQLIQKKIELLEKRVARSNADAEEKHNTRIIQSQLAGAREELANLSRQESRLTVRADITGQIVNFIPGIHEGRYIDQSTPMFTLKSISDLELSGAISEKHIDRIKVGSLGKFYPDNLQMKSIDVELMEMATTSIQNLSYRELSQNHGGIVPVSANNSSSDKERVEGSFYAVKMRAMNSNQQTLAQTQRGIVRLEASKASYAQLTFAQIISVLRRETGF